MKTTSPTHEAIARRAHEIWTDQGSPGGSDTANWLEAERLLTVASPEPHGHGSSAVPPPSPDRMAAQAASRKKAARAPQFPAGKSAPMPAPPTSGKPLWDTPHSS